MRSLCPQFKGLRMRVPQSPRAFMQRCKEYCLARMMRHHGGQHPRSFAARAARGGGGGGVHDGEGSMYERSRLGCVRGVHSSSGVGGGVGVGGEGSSGGDGSGCTSQGKPVLPRSRLLYPHQPLPDVIREGYRAAGVIPLILGQGQEPLMLLGKEIRHRRVVWSEFGGKREPDEADPRDTAVRELMEETRGALTGAEHHIRAVLQTTFDVRDGDDPAPGALPAVWNASGKYVAYFVPLPVEHVSTVPSMMPLQLNHLLGEYQEKTELAWARLVDVAAALHQRRGGMTLAPIGGWKRCADALAGTRPDLAMRLFPFFVSTLAVPGVQKRILKPLLLRTGKDKDVSTATATPPSATADEATTTTATTTATATTTPVHGEGRKSG